MWNNAARTFFWANLATFILVLSTFCFCVFGYVVENIYAKERTTLNTLADSVISSIDFDDHGRSDAGKPDLISSALPDESAKALLPLGLEWFDRSGLLSAQKGNLIIHEEFRKDAGFQMQNNPHAMVLTKPAYAKRRLLGYVRVAQPLADVDIEVSRLATGLTFGAIASLILSGLCITWLVKMSLKPLEISMQQLRQFTADASHEFKNPLMAISSNCSAALRNDAAMRVEDRKKFAAIISIVEDLNRLLDDLLMLATAEQSSSRHTVMTASVDLVSLLMEVIAQQREFHSNKSIEVRTDLPEALIVTGYDMDFRRLFGNVIENAFEYTLNNGRVEISCERMETTTVVIIKDTGIGIDRADTEKVFDRFWRADKARSYRSGGSGLGLSIANSIAAKYRGSISIESALGSGTACRVTLNC